LRDCLTSVYAIETSDVEVIVVDNASSDGSAEMVQTEFPQVILLRNSENRGFAAANNQAIRIASGRYYLLLNSDTIVHGNVLSRSVVYMDDHMNVGVLGCRVLNTDGTVQLTCSKYPTLPNLSLLSSGLWKLDRPKFFDRYLMRNWNRDDERDVEVVSGCYMMVRATAVEQVGLLDENFFFYGEETDWCRRFHENGWCLRFAPVGEITHHGASSGQGLNFKRDLLLSSAMVRLHRKHGGTLRGLTAWLIVFCFNISRAYFWSIASLVRHSPHNINRRNHFLKLICYSHLVWPTSRTLTF
jgi:GT2 family glycosyltransferase